MAFALIFVYFLFCFFTPDILVGQSFVGFRYGDQIFPKYLLVSIKCYSFFFFPLSFIVIVSTPRILSGTH